MSAFVPREMCGRCRRPVSVCYCAALPRIETATRIVILQHPRERTMPIGTARMASLCLPSAELHVGVRWSDSAPLAAALGDPARRPILLYPGPAAGDILRDPPREPVTLVVVDGTWSQAKTVVRDNPVLQALPRYGFATPEPSHYRIRREPRAEFVSTIEALMHVLGVLEGEPARFRSLLDPLRAMVDAQLACQAQSPRRRVRQPRVARPIRRPPEVLARRFADVVCVVGEANAWPRGVRARAEYSRVLGRTSEGPKQQSEEGDEAGRMQNDLLPSPPDELIHWVACRVATGERFEAIAAPELPLSPSALFHAQLAEAALRAGRPRSELVRRFAEFARPDDVVCSWGHYSIGLWLAGGGAAPADWLDLRAAAHRLANRKLGSLEGYAAALGPMPSPLGAGRAGRRLALLVQIIRDWHARFGE